MEALYKILIKKKISDAEYIGDSNWDNFLINLRGLLF